MLDSNTRRDNPASDYSDQVVGTTMALIGMAAATAGSKVAGAVIQNKAANKATQTQVVATKDVQRKQDELYADYKKQMNPYLQSGKDSSQLLGSLMRPSGSPGSYQPNPPPPGGPPPQGYNPWATGGAMPPMGMGQRAVPRMGTGQMPPMGMGQRGGPPPPMNPWGRQLPPPGMPPQGPPPYNPYGGGMQ